MNTLTNIDVAALSDFLEVWSDGLSADLATQVTCTEADALAGLLRAHGHPASAAEWINSHSHGDDEGDEHNRSASSAMAYELAELTSRYPHMRQEYEDPDSFGAGHVVLYSHDGMHRFALTEDCAGTQREPVAWLWESSSHDTASGRWVSAESGRVPAESIAPLTHAASRWAAVHGGPRSR